MPDAMSRDPLAIVIRDAIDTVPVAAAASYVAGNPCSDAMVEHVIRALHAAGYRVVAEPVKGIEMPKASGYWESPEHWVNTVPAAPTEEERQHDQ